MGQVKVALAEYVEREEELYNIKVSLENQIDYHRELITQEIGMFEYYRQDRTAQDIKETFSEFPPDLAVEIFSELGVSKSSIKMHENFSEEANEPYYFYTFDDVWSFLKKLQPFEFFVCMVLIASSNSEWKSISKIQRLIAKEVVNYGLKVNFNKSSVFVAMSFNKDMNKVRQSIIDVVEEFGYKAVLIDIKEHNNQIVPEIFYEIEKSTFVVADLTEHKTGVYLEVGYALAKDKQVVLSCKTNDFHNRHFDVNQINTINWEDEKDLESRLRKRLRTMHFDLI